MKTAIFLGRRLQLKPNGGKGATPGVFIAVAGISLSLIIMIVSVSIVTGFKKEITQKLEGFNASISLYDVTSATPEKARTSGIKLTKSLYASIDSIIPGAQATISIHQPAIFKTDDAFQGVIIKGYPDNAKSSFLKSVITEGRAPRYTNESEEVAISTYMAAKLGLKTGDRVFTHFLDNNNIKTRRFTVSGIYDSHFADFDKMYAFVRIQPLQKLCKVDSLTGSVIEISGIPIKDVDAASERLYNHLVSEVIDGHNEIVYGVDTVTNVCGQFLNWLELLDTNVWVILILMACVSSFTLISSMFILILQRVRTIGLLKAIGASNRVISQTFVYMAVRLVVRGMIIGNIISIVLMYAQKFYHLIPLDAEAYYLNFVPVSVNWIVIAGINLAVLTISWLVLILPSQIIARLSPSRSLRYE